MAEAKLQKLKVTELKDLLSKHGLVQSGKKEELVKRLVDAGVNPDGDDELVDVPEPPAAAEPVPTSAAAAPAPAPAPASAPAPAPTTAAAAAPPPTADAAPAADAPSAPSDADGAAAPAEDELTEEEKKQKARAERFGIPWVRTQPKPAAKPVREPKPAKEAVATSAAAAPKEEKKKAGAIDGTPLGISPEVLARRAAKFGLPTKTTAAAEPEEKKEEEDLSPEAAAQLAADAEKKRKRAEKFGTLEQPANGDESEAKKAKV